MGSIVFPMCRFLQYIYNDYLLDSITYIHTVHSKSNTKCKPSNYPTLLNYQITNIHKFIKLLCQSFRHKKQDNYLKHLVTQMPTYCFLSMSLQQTLLCFHYKNVNNIKSVNHFAYFSSHILQFSTLIPRLLSTKSTETTTPYQHHIYSQQDAAPLDAVFIFCISRPLKHTHTHTQYKTFITKYAISKDYYG